MRSLRVRLALISTLISGAAIIGVSLLAWHSMGRAVRLSTDARLEGIGGRIARDLHPRADEQALAMRYEVVHRDEIAEGLLQLHVRDDVSDREFYSSFEDFEAFRSLFPEGFPTDAPEPRDRPEWSGNPPQRDSLSPPGKRGSFRPPAQKGRPPPPSREFAGEGRGNDLEPTTSPLTEEDIRFLERELFGEDPRPRRETRDPAGPAARPALVTELATVPFEGRNWRVAVIRERGYYVLAALDLTRSMEDLHELERGLLFGIPAALALIGFGGWFVADRALRPIRRIAETTSHITAKDLSLRIDESRESGREVGRLIAVLNEMMDRLESGFTHANRFSADASHELKTPITILLAEIETGLKECRPGTEEENRLLLLRSEAERLKSITRSLMLLAQADVGSLVTDPEPISLSEEVASLVEDAEIAAESKGIELKSEVATGISVRGNPVLLRQAMSNLLENALKYNREGGFIRICLEKARRDFIRFSIENSGAGIPESEQARIFDRFQRVDRSRSRGIDGYGLGLSLAQAIVDAHGGELLLLHSNEESTRFELRLPEGNQTENDSDAVEPTEIVRRTRPREEPS